MIKHSEELYNVIEQTWPTRRRKTIGHWTLSDQLAGKKWVFAATFAGAHNAPNIETAEIGMLELKQTSIFMIQDGQSQLDHELHLRGYSMIDPMYIFVTPTDKLSKKLPPRMCTFDIWEPLEIQKDIWAQAGIDPNYLESMYRANHPKTSLFMRWEGRPAGTAFLAIHNNIAIVHALEILPQQQRKGLGTWGIRKAALWAMAQGAHTLGVVCTKKNKAAKALYASLDMQLVGKYHFRIKKETK